MDKKEFDKLYVAENIVANCKTLELAREFLSLANYFGYEWSGGIDYNEENNWDVYEEDTCYYIKKGMYGDKTYFESKRYTIITYDGNNTLVTW